MMSDDGLVMFRDLLADRSLSLTDEQCRQFNLYYEWLVEWNNKMNLTAITDREQVFLKHFYDSISLSFFHPLVKVDRLADIGSGAGFPSIPLKIMYPHLKVTIIDSLNKRIQFLNHLVDGLGLTHVQRLHGRAEDLARDSALRDQFDLVTARAVARLRVLNELCLPFVKPGGHFIAMKGSDPKEEILEAETSFRELHGELIHVNSFVLPMEQSDRHFVVIQKKKATPKRYPRKAGVPSKTPL